MEYPQVYIVKILYGELESFYFSKPELAKQFYANERDSMRKELLDFDMMEIGGCMTSFLKDDKNYAIVLEQDTLDFPRMRGETYEALYS